jgi:acyl-CoA thioester hydrolase
VFFFELQGIMKELICRTETPVRFSEVDSMGVVWHGNYIKYFEDGRESFGIQYGIGYVDFFRMGILIPLVKIGCDYKRPLKYGDIAIIETRFVNCEAAKLQYTYNIFQKSTDEVVATGSSVQVFLDKNMELLFDIPDFFIQWKKAHGLIS